MSKLITFFLTMIFMSKLQILGFQDYSQQCHTCINCTTRDSWLCLPRVLPVLPTHEKSDSYSFGVVLIELISSLQAVDTNRHRNDINLSSMVVNKIQNCALHELVDTSLGFEMNNNMRRMVTLVTELAFRCLQQERDMRPSMEEVVEALRMIQKDDLNAHMVDIVDLPIDEDSGLLKGSISPTSQDSVY
ncbi:hypothetical protein ACS0TY_015883 [Phlomoides rotata]